MRTADDLFRTLSTYHVLFPFHSSDRVSYLFCVHYSPKKKRASRRVRAVLAETGGPKNNFFVESNCILSFSLK